MRELLDQLVGEVQEDATSVEIQGTESSVTNQQGAVRIFYFFCTRIPVWHAAVSVQLKILFFDCFLFFFVLSMQVLISVMRSNILTREIWRMCVLITITRALPLET